MLRDHAQWIALPPFLDAKRYALPAHYSDSPRLIAVAMLRPGDKLTSYLPPAERNSDDDAGNVAQMPPAAEQEAA